MRACLLFAAVQGFGIGLTGIFVPSEMHIPLRITPVNARFLAALYIAGGIGVLLAAVARSVCSSGPARTFFISLWVRLRYSWVWPRSRHDAAKCAWHDRERRRKWTDELAVGLTIRDGADSNWVAA